MAMFRSRGRSVISPSPIRRGSGRIASHLLRRVADTIEGLGPVEVQDITFTAQITEDGDWPQMTVYSYAPGDPD